jgi:hypothetical protein
MVSAALQSHSSALSYAVKQLIAQELATAAMRRNSDEYGREIKGLSHWVLLSAEMPASICTHLPEFLFSSTKVAELLRASRKIKTTRPQWSQRHGATLTPQNNISRSLLHSVHINPPSLPRF